MSQRNVYIFVAGSISMRDERTVFKAIASDLNNEYELAHENVKLRVYSCEHFIDKQDKYMDFIRDKSNLIIFVLENEIGEITKGEYIFASKCQHRYGRPNIMVFIKDYEEETGDIRYICGLMDACTNTYFTKYRDLEELKLLGKEKLRLYLGDVQRSKPNRSGGFMNRLKGYKEVIVAVAIVLVFFAGVQVAYKNINHPQLIIAGGGSAANYISDVYGVDLEKYRGGFYMHMATGTAWSVLSEEAYGIPKTLDLIKARRFFPVCVSAGKADTSCFTLVATAKSIRECGKIMSVLLGYDTLAVYVSVKDSLGLPKMMNANLALNYVKADSLLFLLNRKKELGLNVYATSPTSGTKHSYNVEFLPDSLHSTPTIFGDMSSLEDDIAVPFVLLGSRHYKASGLDDNPNECVRLWLKGKNGDVIRKPIYLYFMAYKTENGKLWVPDPTVDLLDKLGVKVSEFIDNDNFCHLERQSTDLIIDLIDKPLNEMK